MRLWRNYLWSIHGKKIIVNILNRQIIGILSGISYSSNSDSTLITLMDLNHDSISPYFVNINGRGITNIEEFKNEGKELI